MVGDPTRDPTNIRHAYPPPIQKQYSLGEVSLGEGSDGFQMCLLL